MKAKCPSIVHSGNCLANTLENKLGFEGWSPGFFEKKDPRSIRDACKLEPPVHGHVWNMSGNIF